MSLKTFHIFFISLASLCSFGFGVWLLLLNDPRSNLDVIGAFLSFVVGIGLIIYGILFLRKFKHISFM